MRFGKGEDGRPRPERGGGGNDRKRVRTTGLWTRPREANESNNGGGGGFSKWSMSRNDEGTTEGARNDTVVMLLRLSVSRHALVGFEREQSGND